MSVTSDEERTLPHAWRESRTKANARAVHEGGDSGSERSAADAARGAGYVGLANVDPHALRLPSRKSIHNPINNRDDYRGSDIEN